MAKTKGPQVQINHSAREVHFLVPNSRGVMTPVLNRKGEPDNLYADLTSLGQRNFADHLRRIAKGCDVEIPPTVDHGSAEFDGDFTRDRFEQIRRRAHQEKYQQW